MNRVWVLGALTICIGFSASCSGGSTWGNGDAGASSGGSSGGSSSGGADAFVQAAVGSGPQSSAAMCPLGPGTAAWLNVGSATAGKPTTVQDGGNNGTGNVAVTCKVTPSGNGFDIDLSIDQNGAQGASITISSPAGQGAVTTSGATTGITATFTSVDNGGPYSSNNCTLTFAYQGQPVPVSPPVAAGRIWGHVSCPVAQLGGQPGKQCDAEADFLFEQCQQ